MGPGVRRSGLGTRQRLAGDERVSLSPDPPVSMSLCPSVLLFLCLPFSLLSLPLCLAVGGVVLESGPNGSW